MNWIVRKKPKEKKEKNVLDLDAAKRDVAHTDAHATYGNDGYKRLILFVFFRRFEG